MKLANFFLYCLGVLMCHSEASCQTPKHTQTLNSKTLSGYFIVLREQIIIKDSDNTYPKDFVTVYFEKSLNDTILNTFKNFKTEVNDKIVCVTEPYGNTPLYSSEDSKKVYEFLTKHYTLKDLHEYNPFNLSNIPSFIIDGDHQFIAIFFGKLSVIGPYESQNIINRNLFCDTYIILKDNSNNLTYKYSIVMTPDK